MKRALCVKTIIFLFTMAYVLITAPTILADNSRETLKQYIADLQKNPNDQVLREKIIKLAQEIKPAPAISEEARRYFVKAVTVQKEAKDAKVIELAVNAYNQALLIAPWWQDAYYNLSIALEQLGRLDEAASALKLYLLTNPSASEARAAQDKIYALEAKKEMAQAQKAEEETAKAKEEKKEALPPFEGRWYFKGELGNAYGKPDEDFVISCSNGQWQIQRPDGKCAYDRVSVQGRQIAFREIQNPAVSGETYTFSYKLTLSEDGKKLEGTQQYFFQGASQGEFIQVYCRRE